MIYYHVIAIDSPSYGHVTSAWPTREEAERHIAAEVADLRSVPGQSRSYLERAIVAAEHGAHDPGARIRYAPADRYRGTSGARSVVTLRLADSEVAEIDAAAERARRTRSDWARLALLDAARAG